MDVALLDQALDDLLPDWRALHAADPHATPFTSAGWAQAWWRHWGQGARPWLLAVHDAETLVGLAPLALARAGPLRVLRGLGRHPGDYWDVLALPELRERVVELVGEALLEHAGRWDLLIANGLPPGSATPGALGEHGCRVARRPSSPCPAIDLPDSFDAYLATLSRQHRGNLRRHLRRLDGGEVTLRELRGPEDLEPAIARWSELRARQWEVAGRALTPQQRDPRFTPFVRDVALALVPQGLAQVRELRTGGRVVGIYVDFIDGATFYWFLGGFDPEAAALGLGKIAAGEAIRSSIAAGRARFDFAHGAEAYKYWFGARDRPSESLLVGSGRLRSRAALGAARIAGRVRDGRGAGS
ncbi:MAG: glycosyl transferase group 1 [Solirubrobacterales bacterium]|jgi:CelD/BcsL family acetyltransferase involved in cellulose biosynthesis|nr:glycosyl transferase group 1 [Solirubrobacterales bacterium]